MISILTLLFDPLLEVCCVLATNSQKATVYFLLAVISGFLLGTTCICGHWIALKLSPITSETSSRSGIGVQTDEVGGVRLSGMTSSLASSHKSHRNNGKSKIRGVNNQPNSSGSNNNNPFIVESDNGANCEVISPVMEDERVSTVASTAPDRTLLLSASHYRITAPKYRSPPRYHHKQPESSNASINATEFAQNDEDYADYDERDLEDQEHERRKSLQQMMFRSQELDDQVYFANEYEQRRHMNPNGTIKSTATTTTTSINPNSSLNRLHHHNNHRRHPSSISAPGQRQQIISSPTPHHRFSWIFVRETLV